MLGLLGRIETGGGTRLRARSLLVRASSGIDTITSPVIHTQLVSRGIAEPNPAPRIPIKSKETRPFSVIADDEPVSAAIGDTTMRSRPPRARSVAVNSDAIEREQVRSCLTTVAILPSA